MQDDNKNSLVIKFIQKKKLPCPCANEKARERGTGKAAILMLMQALVLITRHKVVLQVSTSEGRKIIVRLLVVLCGNIASMPNKALM